MEEDLGVKAKEVGAVLEVANSVLAVRASVVHGFDQIWLYWSSIGLFRRFSCSIKQYLDEFYFPFYSVRNFACLYSLHITISLWSWDLWIVFVICVGLCNYRLWTFKLKLRQWNEFDVLFSFFFLYVYGGCNASFIYWLGKPLYFVLSSHFHICYLAFCFVSPS